MEKIPFSIVLIIKDDANLLMCSLLSIEHIQYPTDAFEVIVIDDGSSPAIEKKIDSSVFSFNLKFSYVGRTQESSRAKARNIGASLANYEHIVFVDGDHFFDPTLLENYNRYFLFKRNRQVVLGKRKHLRHSTWPKASKILKTNPLDLDPLEKLAFHEERSDMLKVLKKEFFDFRGRWYFFWSCNFCIKKSLYDSIGGFDENFLGWGLEDVELGYRLLKENTPFELIDNFVWHFIKPLPVTKEKYSQWLDNLQYFYRKYDDIRILELMSFEDIFFYTANSFPDTSFAVEQSYLNFERKLEFIENIHLPSRDKE